MLQLISVQLGGVWISTGLPCIYAYNEPHVYSILSCTGPSRTLTPALSGHCLYVHTMSSNVSCLEEIYLISLSDIYTG
jgi:hypothetical protein